jgi:hypothetical protein
MAGILDKKTRFIDLVVTQEGKRQIASGKLRVEYASATDMHAYYDKSENYDDATNNIYFEAMERPENSIVLETDDSGKLIQFDMSPTGSIIGDKIFNKEDQIPENIHQLKISTGSQFASLANDLPNIFIKNFRKNHFIATQESINVENEFELSNTSANFFIRNSIPFENGAKNQIINVNDAEPFFLDKKLSHLPNFAFLPPINEDGTSFGEYEDYRSTQNGSWENIVEELGNKAFIDRLAPGSLKGADFESRKQILQNLIGDYDYQENNVTLKKEYKIFEFSKTSQSNNILIQIYENHLDKFKKLDVIDGGSFFVKDDQNRNVEKRVFYAGKIYFDDFNAPTFVNLFTLIFE